MKCLSRKELEEIADRIIAQYKIYIGKQDTQMFTIDPEIIATNILGLRLGFEHLSLDGGTLGITTFSELGIEIFTNDGCDEIYFLDGHTILVEKDLNEDITLLGRKNFTIMHEASHQILKILFPNDYGAKVSRRYYYRETTSYKKPIDDWEEWQANTLASAILMPLGTVKYCMYLFGLGEKLKVLNKVYMPKEYEKFCNMASYMGVSKTALAIRMKQLGLLEKEYLRNPHDILDICVEGNGL